MGEPIKKTRQLGAAPKVSIRNADGSNGAEVTLAAEYFALEPNVAVMHQVVNAQLAAARAGTQSTKTRAEVQGGGAKPWRQKGTGRARAGSLRAPNFSGGGVAHGPKPRSYKQKTPKKMVQLALRSALSDRAAEGKVIVLDSFGFEAPKTKDAVALLKSWDVQGSTLLVLGVEDEVAYLSFRNLQNVTVVPATELNVFDILRHDYLVFTTATLPGGNSDASPAPKVSKAKASKTSEEGAGE